MPNPIYWGRLVENPHSLEDIKIEMGDGSRHHLVGLERPLGSEIPKHVYDPSSGKLVQRSKKSAERIAMERGANLIVDPWTPEFKQGSSRKKGVYLLFNVPEGRF